MVIILETETIGKLFLVKLTKWGANYRYPLGFVVKCMNEGTNCRLALPVLLAESGIRPRPPKQVVTEFRRLYPKTWQIPEQERKRRPFYKDAITLDPEGNLFGCYILSILTSLCTSIIYSRHKTS